MAGQSKGSRAWPCPTRRRSTDARFAIVAATSVSRSLSVLVAGVGVLPLSTVGCAHRPWVNPGDDWKVVTSEHFNVRTDSDDGDYETVLGRLEDVHEALSATFFAGVSVPRVEVHLLRRKSDFKAMAPMKAGGFFTTAAERARGGILVFSTDEDDFEIVASIAAHELAHRFLHALHDNVPVWLHEGFAKYVGGIELPDNLVAFDAAELHGGYVYFADPVPLGRLFVLGRRDFHGGADAEYMTAWMLMRQLFGSRSDGATGRFRALAAAAAKAPNPTVQAEAVRAAFGGADISDIDRAIQQSHSAIYHGVGQEPSRRALAITLKRAKRIPLRVVPASRTDIRALCTVLRERRS